MENAHQNEVKEQTKIIKGPQANAGLQLLYGYRPPGFGIVIQRSP